jgi:hypothetical protein
MTAYLRTFSVAVFILMTGFTQCQVVLAQNVRDRSAPATKEKEPPTQLTVACSPDKPIVHPGEAVNVRAYADSAAGKPVQYAWAAPVGRLNGQGAEVNWDFTGVALGVHEAKLSLKDASGGVVQCSVRIIVEAQSRQPLRGNRETGRSFLLPNEVEENGYGLYSYLLLGSRPTAASRERYLKAIEEYLRFPDITRFETYNTPRRTLNVTYLPLLTFPFRQIVERLADEHYGEVAEWALKQYDYERARVLLRGLPGNQREGPYIVSFLKPPTWNGPPSRPYLYQDQSSVPPHLVSLWAREFLNQAAQEQFWQERTAVHMVLKLRTAIGILAVALPEPKKRLENWIAWVS